MPPALAHGAGVFLEPAQAAHKAEADRVVIIQAKLHGKVCILAQFFLDRQLHGEAMLHRFAFDDLDLGHRGGQVMQPVQVGFRHVLPDHHQEGEIGVLLGGNRGQGEAFEMAKAQLHPGGGIEIGLALFDSVMHAFEPAQGGIGKPADSDHAHALS
ncbi:hypothetical protein RTM1035_02765 [Roseovarius sp. TM1035]|nr:hypothetical protein RTM1035_02765 [Roseovarius sp. TM1035]